MTKTCVMVCVSLFALVSVSLAADVDWTVDRLVDGNSISTDGILLEALNPGRETLGGDVTVNGVTFVGKHDTNDTAYFTFDPENGNPTGPPNGEAYQGDLPFGDELLDGFYWTGNEVVKEITLQGLIPGQTYLVQALVSDDRGLLWGTDFDTRHIAGSGIGSIETTNYGSTVDPLVMNGLFVAENASEALLFEVVQDGNSLGNTQFNAIQLRGLGWVSQDVGPVAEAGSADVNDGVFTITGAGNVWNPDSFHYVYRKLEGDFEIVASLDDLDDVDQWTKGGLMISGAPDVNSANAFIYGSPDWDISMQGRAVKGNGPDWLGGNPAAPLTFPVNLRLTKEGNLVSGYYSRDGGDWEMIREGYEVSIDGDVYAGMAVAVTTPNDVNTATAVFSDVQIIKSATFDWEEHEGQWWVSYGYTEVDNGVTLISGGRAAANDGGDGPGGDNGKSFKATYFQDEVAGTFNMQVGGIDVDFIVKSLDISAADGGVAGSVSVVGMLDGVEQWTIVPENTNVLTPYAAATTGDMALPIDQIVWNGFWSADNSVLLWDNAIDNLSVEAIVK